ncbi:hypothetical protein AB1Y20_010483 [Prymnesium parvum]|uniref:Glutamyl-tRNA reductase n=1 Tax=Prymnesium parvum TaxID=97485 RepID=A0AB34IS26_PRYPA
MMLIALVLAQLLVVSTIHAGGVAVTRIAGVPGAAGRSALGGLSAQHVSRMGAATMVATQPEQTVVADVEKPLKPVVAPAKAEKEQSKKKGAPRHGQPLVIGLSHKTATVEVREKLSIPEANWNVASKALCGYESVQEAAVLSTCNRFEVYIVAEDPYLATRDVMAYLRDHSGLTDLELRPNLFVLQNEDAVWHLLRVASGLDSLVVGEGQILSQVKACYSQAIEPAVEASEDSKGSVGGSAGKVLGRLLNSAVMSGKFVRSETEIAKGAVSISSAAVELAIHKSMPDLGKPLAALRVTIVGAGKMSRLLMTHLASHGVTKITLLNRSRPRAEELAAEYPDLDVEVGVTDGSDEYFWQVLERTDLAFTSTSATGCILTEKGLRNAVWGGEDADKLMVIDISVPRNVESACNNVPGVRAYNVDDLKQVVAANQAKRAHKVLEAEVLLRVELQKFLAWQESLKYVPTISQLQSKFEAVRQAELAKAQKKGLKNLSDKERQAVDIATKGIINKLLHAPMAYLRSDDHDGSKATVRQILEIFQLEN